MRLVPILILLSFPVACGASNTAKVCLTFDDTLTTSVLDSLAGIPVTFFPVSNGLLASVRDRALTEGHQIGNHTSNHVNLSTLTLEQQLEEVELADRQIGFRTKYLRPPYGERNSNTYKLGKRVIMWDRNLDTENPSPGIMLLHREDRIPYIIGYVRNHGMQFAPLEDCLL